MLSELPPLQQPMSGTFPQRNRLITGLSLGVLVVEAAERSGALISATHAAEQGREVFAVPGPADSRMSRGCHRLIRDGAKLVETVEDVLEELGPLFEPMQREDGHTLRHPAELQLNQQERQVLDAIATRADQYGRGRPHHRPAGPACLGHDQRAGDPPPHPTRRRQLRRAAVKRAAASSGG